MDGQKLSEYNMNDNAVMEFTLDSVWGDTPIGSLCADVFTAMVEQGQDKVQLALALAPTITLQGPEQPSELCS